MRVREKTLQNYLGTLLKNDRVREFITDQVPSKRIGNFHPALSVVNQVSRKNASQYAGMALGSRTIQISQWICVDKDQSFSTVRHELAHCIQNWCNLPGSHHGSGFTVALKLVSPRTWRKDRHWKRTPSVENARQEINNRVWNSVDTRKYYIQIDNGSKFAWRQLTFDEIVEEFKQDPRKLWTGGIHCTRINITFQCPDCKINLYPKTQGAENSEYRTVEREWANVESYLVCPKCEKQTKGYVNLLGRKSWSGILKTWIK